MSTEDVANALTSYALGPTVGAVAVLLAILIGRYKDGVPFGAQLEAAFESSRGPLMMALLALGGALVAGLDFAPALSAGVSAFLAAANLSPKKSAGNLW